MQIFVDKEGNIVGETRKVESKMKTRVYRRRVLPEDPKPPVPIEENKKPTPDQQKVIAMENSTKVIDQFFKNNNHRSRGRRKK